MGRNFEVRTFDNPDSMFVGVANELVRSIHESIWSEFHIALSGGETPNGLYDLLAMNYLNKIPWNKVHFWWGDERCVAPDSDQSNYKSAYERLICYTGIPERNIHRIRGEEVPEEEAARYALEIKHFLKFRGEFPVFDLILLGMGSDGHSVSIFPDQLDLFEDKRYCISTFHPLTNQPRITLTGKALNNASRLFMIVSGKNKSQRVSEIMDNNEAAKLLPAYYISPVKGKLIWFLDEDAAAQIRSKLF